MDNRPSRIALLVLVAALFVTAASAAAVTEPQVAQVDRPAFEFGAGSGEDPGDAEPPRRDSGADLEGPSLGDEPGILAGFGDSPLVRFLATLLLIVLLAVVAVILWRTMRDRVTLRRLPERDAAEARKEQVRAAVQASLDELAADWPDPRSAVIGCWLRLEKAAAVAGTRCEAADTPADLVARMLAEQQVSRPALDRLAAAYRQARYAPHEIGEELRDQAREALRRVHAELSGARRHDGERVAP
ncbi:MAG: DUF4129 domain-containing protein [Micromonosporaceae bacterium]|nr:DUF4129 domain-containing protein [Micromonosporaceae bacterium]